MEARSFFKTWPFDDIFPLEFGRKSICETANEAREGVSNIHLWRKYPLTFHDVGLILCASFTALALGLSVYLIWRHASHFLKRQEQKCIIRILLMVPIYAVVSFLSYLAYHGAVYFELARDCYEPVTIASFFSLLCHYVAPTLHEQKDYFRNIEPKNWIPPLCWLQRLAGGQDKGWLRRARSGLTWFNIIWVAVFQYCIVRPIFTLIAAVAQYYGRYCHSSKDPRFAYVWVLGFEATSLTVAMYCLMQFYIQLKQDIAVHRPGLKFMCIKLVLFFCFWQTHVIALLTAKDGPIKPAKQWISGPDLRVGLPSLLVCAEMAAFALLHIFTFDWQPYNLNGKGLLEGTTEDQPGVYACGPLCAILIAANPWDIMKGFGRGIRWLVLGVRRRKRDHSYHGVQQSTLAERRLAALSTSYGVEVRFGQTSWYDGNARTLRRFSEHISTGVEVTEWRGLRGPTRRRRAVAKTI
ncbi:DUF300-domain-containing protein [Westerdykella ornata]|uniref:DUF300-domain-containing protein n=1 Tax=Westerdykella ornata TaxID=318751 RepID=A0A6A6JKP3_WESOR|nr:DUF300-domain-containing protein [Westerdykella ornata]KAF2277052.1 DUF300-domain-containing protein [Westerdykella ornata]